MVWKNVRGFRCSHPEELYDFELETVEPPPKTNLSMKIYTMATLQTIAITPRDKELNLSVQRSQDEISIVKRHSPKTIYSTSKNTPPPDRVVLRKKTK